MEGQLYGRLFIVKFGVNWLISIMHAVPVVPPELEHLDLYAGL